MSNVSTIKARRYTLSEEGAEPVVTIAFTGGDLTEEEERAIRRGMHEGYEAARAAVEGARKPERPVDPGEVRKAMQALVVACEHEIERAA